MSKHVLEGISVSKYFGGLRANDDVTIRVGAAEIVGMIGPNGSGKTTFFNCVAGNHPPDAGKILLSGKDVTNFSPQHVARLGVIRTFQHTRTYLEMTCSECLLISAPPRELDSWRLLGTFSDELRHRAHELLMQFGLSEKADEKAGQLSFGQRRLLEIAMAVMKEPRVILLDEPTAGIDPSNIAMLVNLVSDMAHKRGISILLIEHNVPVVTEIASRLYCMNAGCVLVEGTPKEVVSDPRVLAAYLGSTSVAGLGI